MSEASTYRRWFISEDALASAALPDPLRRAIRSWPDTLSEEADQDLVVVTARELLRHGRSRLPTWIGTETRYLVLMDAPEPSLLRIPSILRLHKPDQRMYATRDPLVLTRLVVGIHREEAWEGILDAYVVDDELVVTLADFTTRRFPRKRLPVVGKFGSDDFRDFRIDPQGSYLHWPSSDVHLGPSQMLQAVDPAHLADVEIRRYGLEKVSLALLAMREERGLTQEEIDGLSARHVRRLEKEEKTRLTVDAARSYADAFDTTLEDFLDELGRRISALRGEKMAGVADGP